MSASQAEASAGIGGAARFRTLGGGARLVERTLLAALALVGIGWALELHSALPFAVFKEQYLGLFLALALAAVFVAVPARPGDSVLRVPWFDWLLAAGGLVVGLYVAIRYPTLAYSLGVITPEKLALGALAILLVLEATRRLCGWALVWVALACLAYAKFAAFLPEPLTAKSATWGRLAVYLYLDANGLFGVALAVAAGIVVAFVLFGQVLGAVGGDRFLTDLALVAMGRYRGGPAKVAVVSSTLFGTVSGSAVSNVVVDGALTIPMMKRAGYPPHLAAAIEAVASNGGQIMPPVMGAAAFLIAEYLGLSYGEVALAAAIPAGLYYLALFVQVDLEAAKRGLAGLPAAELPRLGPVLRTGGIFVVPLGVLVYTLMLAGWEPGAGGARGGRRGARGGLPRASDAPELGRHRERRGGDGPHHARPHGHHRAGGARHRRPAALRLHVEAAAPPPRPRRGAGPRAARSHGRGLHRSRDVASHHGRVRDAGGPGRPRADPARDPPPRGPPLPLLLRHALAHHAAGLSRDLHGGRHRAGGFLEDGLDGDAARHRRLRGPVRVRLPARPPGQGARRRRRRGGPGRGGGRDRPGGGLRGLPRAAALVGPARRPRRHGTPGPRLRRRPGARPRARGLAAGLLLVLWEWAAARPSRPAHVQPGPERPATREIR